MGGNASGKFSVSIEADISVFEEVDLSNLSVSVDLSDNFDNLTDDSASDLIFDITGKLVHVGVMRGLIGGQTAQDVVARGVSRLRESISSAIEDEALDRLENSDTGPGECG